MHALDVINAELEERAKASCETVALMMEELIRDCMEVFTSGNETDYLMSMLYALTDRDYLAGKWQDTPGGPEHWSDGAVDLLYGIVRDLYSEF